jgi:hypothetical protein
VLEGLISDITDAIKTPEQARAALLQAATTRGVAADKVLRAIAFLEKVRSPNIAAFEYSMEA